MTVEWDPSIMACWTLIQGDDSICSLCPWLDFDMTTLSLGNFGFSWFCAIPPWVKCFHKCIPHWVCSTHWARALSLPYLFRVFFPFPPPTLRSTMTENCDEGVYYSLKFEPWLSWLSETNECMFVSYRQHHFVMVSTLYELSTLSFFYGPTQTKKWKGWAD